MWARAFWGEKKVFKKVDFLIKLLTGNAFFERFLGYPTFGGQKFDSIER